MTSAAVATLIGAVLAAVIAATVADLLTVTGRLRRKLERELSIWDKLPPGTAKTVLGQVAERRALELVWRDANRETSRPAFGLLYAGFVGLVAIVSGLVSKAQDPSKPTGLPSDPLINLVPFVALIGAFSILRAVRRARIAYLDSMEPSLVSNLARPPARRVRLTPLAPTGPQQPTRRAWPRRVWDRVRPSTRS